MINTSIGQTVDRVLRYKYYRGAQLLLNSIKHLLYSANSTTVDFLAVDLLRELFKVVQDEYNVCFPNEELYYEVDLASARIKFKSTVGGSDGR